MSIDPAVHLQKNAAMKFVVMWLIELKRESRSVFNTTETTENFTSQNEVCSYALFLRPSGAPIVSSYFRAVRGEMILDSSSRRV